MLQRYHDKILKRNKYLAMFVLLCSFKNVFEVFYLVLSFDDDKPVDSNKHRKTFKNLFFVCLFLFLLLYFGVQAFEVHLKAK